MRKNLTQTGNLGEGNRTYIEGDWYAHGIPSNVVLAPNVYIDTSYGFAAFHSQDPNAMYVDVASGCYDRSSFIVSVKGKIQVGKFCIINGATLVCNQNITMGDHCMVSWGTVIMDSWIPQSLSIQDRRKILHKTAKDPLRGFPFYNESAPVIMEDNSWIGFGSIIMPGVRLGKGCIIGCKTIITKDVPPYAVVIGEDERIVKYLDPNDDEKTKQNALFKYTHT